MRQGWNTMWATGGCLGLIPFAPGTMGSLMPVGILLVCGHFKVPVPWLIGVLLAIIFAASIATIILAPWYADRFGKHDPPQVVSDEVVGQSIALLGMAWLEPHIDVSPIIWISLVLLAFVLFRIFDIWKPSLIDRAQHAKAGWGVLLDDVLAGIAAGAIVLVCAWTVLNMDGA